MAAGWIIKRNNKENGPFSSQQLKQFAVAGKLKREDLIRKEPGGKFMPANSIKGLFPEEKPPEEEAWDDEAFLNVDISRYQDVPAGEDDEDEEEERPRKRKGGTKTRSGSTGKGKKAGSKTKKGKSRKKDEDDWEDDPVNDLFFGGLLVFFGVGTMFFMNPEEYELPGLMVTIHEYTGRFGVAAFLILLSLIFWVQAFQKIGRLREKGKPIPWHLPVIAWLFAGLFSSDESEEE